MVLRRVLTYLGTPDQRLKARIHLKTADEVFISSRTRLTRWDLPTPWGPNRSTELEPPVDTVWSIRSVSSMKESRLFNERVKTIQFVNSVYTI